MQTSRNLKNYVKRGVTIYLSVWCGVFTPITFCVVQLLRHRGERKTFFNPPSSCRNEPSDYRRRLRKTVITRECTKRDFWCSEKWTLCRSNKTEFFSDFWRGFPKFFTKKGRFSETQFSGQLSWLPVFEFNQRLQIQGQTIRFEVHKRCTQPHENNDYHYSRLIVFFEIKVYIL